MSPFKLAPFILEIYTEKYTFGLKDIESCNWLALYREKYIFFLSPFDINKQFRRVVLHPLPVPIHIVSGHMPNACVYCLL